jgi:PilZ domain
MKGCVMSSELRKHPRHLTLQTAKIFTDSHSPAIPCAVLNLSDGGACVLLPSRTYVPGLFDMAMDHNNTFYECRVAWRRGDKIGVAFSAREHSGAKAAQARANAANAVPANALRSAPSGRLRG